MTMPLNEKRFEQVELLPAISTKNKELSINMSFDKQVSREQFNRVFLQKQEDHKVAPDAYNASYNLRHGRTKGISLGSKGSVRTRLGQSLHVPVLRNHASSRYNTETSEKGGNAPEV